MMAKQLQYRIRPAIGEPQTAWQIDDTARVIRKEWQERLNARKYAGEVEYRVVEVSAAALKKVRA
ncbi:MAG TPA: hypothetical protein VFA39_15770 [Steroidobacteraceae bacterium]|nr:hypothetical protein [Steroidobacteraceae bacterium]